MSEQRKASDILLDLETKIDHLVKLNSSLEFNQKVMSNKLNEIMSVLGKENTAPQMGSELYTANTDTFEEADEKGKILSSNDFKLPMQNGPQHSYGRTSRSETFETIRPTPPPTGERPPVIKVPANIQKMPQIKTDVPMVPVQEKKLPNKIDTSARVAVEQRVVNRQGKAVFLANIDVVEVNSKETIGSARTNAIGKWSCSLPIGQYNVIVKKMNPDTKEMIEITQNLLVDGTETPLRLQPMIIK